jgi:tetratricopeptide (TPR) repeat protein
MHDVDPEILAQIRHAAFELRTSDPQAAVRILRRAAAWGGGAEVLARGALGEIYLTELGDLDGAEHEYRRVLALAPGLAAAELGLARVLRETGAIGEAQEHYRSAVASLANEVASFRERAASGHPIPPGAEEVVLTLLEAALEERALPATGGKCPFDESLLDWAVREKLFDALSGEEGDPAEDWFRFHSLRARLLWLEERREDSAQAHAVAVAILQQAIAAAETRLASATPEERDRLDEEIRGYRDALAESSGGLVSLRSPRA